MKKRSAFLLLSSLMILIMILITVTATFSAAPVLNPTVSVTHSPLNPISTQQVLFTANAQFTSSAGGVVYIDVDSVNKNNCPINSNSGTCSYSGGPYAASSTHSYKARVFDYNSNSWAENQGIFTVSTFYTLTINKAGTGSGTVVSEDERINCGNSCTANYQSGTFITLNAGASPGSTFAGWSLGISIASPPPGSTFAGWSGAGCSGTSSCIVTMDSAKTVTATFNLLTCINECSVSGLEQCNGNGYQVCGNYDLDSCLEWNSITLCSSGQSCNNGQCILCSLECNSGQRRCNGNGYQVCQDLNQNGCYEWGQITNCNSAQTCSNGYCSSKISTSDKCFDNTPSGQCSINRPLYCKNSILINDCNKCGCNGNGVCLADGFCISTLQYESIKDVNLLRGDIKINYLPKFRIIQDQKFFLNLDDYVNDLQNRKVIIKFSNNQYDFISDILDCNLNDNLITCNPKNPGSILINLIADDGIKKMEFSMELEVIKIPIILNEEDKNKHKPIANAGLDITIATNSYFILDGSSSYDQDNDLTEDSFKWYENEVLIGSGKLVKLKYHQPGKHKIKLVVKNTLDLASEDFVLVNVASKNKCKNTNSKYYPEDTICNSKWPSKGGEIIVINSRDYSCNLVEVCDDNLDYIIEDSIDCCDSTPLNDQNKAKSCNFANKYSNDNAEKCQALYLIKSLGADQIYMQNYLEAEMCCRGIDQLCSNKNYLYQAKPIPSNRNNLNNLKCYNTPLNNPPGSWVSDTDLDKNNIALADLPAHVSLNKLSTGTCVDYSFSLTTLLRKARYKQYDVMTVESPDHAYNLIKFPLDKKYTIVDTTGNNEPPIVFGSVPYGYKYCENIKNCYNDNGKILCPKLSEINGCEKSKQTFFQENRFKALEVVDKIKEFSNSFIKEIEK